MFVVKRLFAGSKFAVNYSQKIIRLNQKASD